MKILIIYGTSEGQTRKIARFMEDVLQEKGHQVSIADATEEPPLPIDYDAVMIGGSIHMHRYHDAIHDYIADHLEELKKRHTAFFSVCLAVASDFPEEQQEAYKITQEFLAWLRWRPDEVIHFAGAIKYTKYDFFKRLVMRMIAKQEGGSTDTSQDHEYTNWDKVRKFALDFVSGPSVGTQTQHNLEQH